MRRPDTEFDLTVRETLTRNPETDAEEIMWVVESDYMDRGRGGETPADALRNLAQALDEESEETPSVAALAAD